MFLVCSTKAEGLVTVVYNHWTSGLDWWTGPVDWIGGLDWWTGLVDWTVGLDWWTDIFCAFVLSYETSLSCRFRHDAISFINLDTPFSLFKHKVTVMLQQ